MIAIQPVYWGSYVANTALKTGARRTALTAAFQAAFGANTAAIQDLTTGVLTYQSAVLRDHVAEGVEKR